MCKLSESIQSSNNTVCLTIKSRGVFEIDTRFVRKSRIIPFFIIREFIGRVIIFYVRNIYLRVTVCNYNITCNSFNLFIYLLLFARANKRYAVNSLRLTPLDAGIT